MHDIHQLSMYQNSIEKKNRAHTISANKCVYSLLYTSIVYSQEGVYARVLYCKHVCVYMYKCVVSFLFLPCTVTLRVQIKLRKFIKGFIYIHNLLRTTRCHLRLSQKNSLERAKHTNTIPYGPKTYAIAMNRNKSALILKYTSD